MSCVSYALDNAASIRAAKTALLASLPPVALPHINGAPLPWSGPTFATENPATGETLTQVARGDAATVDIAVAAAKAAFPGWSATPPAERKKALLRLADALERAAPEVALLDCLEGGKPIHVTLTTDLPDTVECLRFHAEACDKINGQLTPVGPDIVSMIVNEPLGVVGAVVPWNFPIQMALWKIAPALATGCTVVLKPSELTSLSALKLASLAVGILPPGTLNVVPGLGEEAGKAMGLHPDIAVVAFTGSVEVGRIFLRYSADSNLKRVTLELGGKSPQVVLGDVTASQLPDIVPYMLAGAFWNMGENCSCGSRVLVHRSLHDALVAALVAGLEKDYPVGDPLEPSTRVGALIEKPHYERVLAWVTKAVAGGARVACGGGMATVGSGAGYYVTPTILTGVTNDMPVAQEEIFGPVLCVIAVDSDEEALRLANDTPFGLAASLYTNSLSLAHRGARTLRAGNVSVNCFAEGDATTPFGGFKQSGFSGVDKSLMAHANYTHAKTIWMKI